MYFWQYYIQLTRKKHKLGIFRTTVNIFEGDTKEQTRDCITAVMVNSEIPMETLKWFTIQRIEPERIKEILRECKDIL